MKERLKVLMVGPDRSVHGGISGVVNGYYEAGLDKKINMKYISTMREGSKIKKLIVAVAAFLRFLLLLPRYNIVHVHMASDNSYRRKSYFIRAAAAFNKKLIIHQHGGNIKKYYYEQLSEKDCQKMRNILNMADIFFVLTPEWVGFFEKIVDKKKIQVFPNCISVNPIEEKVYGGRKLLFLGRICNDKGVRELFDSIRKVSDRFPDIKLYMGGIWEDRNLEKEAKRYPKIIFPMGWLDSEGKKNMLRCCDIYVLPSYYEGQPMSVLEAMASGCAVIASRVGGIPDMIKDGESGLLISPRNEEDLENALIKVLENPAFCRQLGERARVEVEKSFSIEKSLERLIKIYEVISVC